MLERLRYGYFYIIFITKKANIAIYKKNKLTNNKISELEKRISDLENK